MAKKLSKILWHDTKVDGAGKPVLPSVATDDKGLNGLLPGELFMHVGKEKVSLWALSLSGEVVEVSGKTDEVDIDLSDYLLKSVWDSVFEIKTDVSGQKYIFGKLPVVTKYGVTMYADDGTLNLPSIYEGLPIDNITLYWDNGVLKAKGGEGGGGGVADSIAWANVYGKPSWVTDTKPIYNYSEIKNTPDLSVFVTDTALSNTLADYATLSYLTGELKKYVTIKGNEDVTGVHDFVNGLKIGNIKLSKSQDGVLYLEGNLVVKGGVTMYALDEVTVDSIIDSLPLASTSQYGIAKFNPSNFVINEDGFVTIIGGSSGLDIEELAEYLATNKYVTQGWVEGKGYITSSALNGYATQSWVTNQKYITGITSVMVVSALGYTPFNNASFTKSNIKSTLGISDWALASTKPSYNFSEIGTKPTTIAGYGITDAYTIQQADALYAKYLPLTGGTLTGALRIVKTNGIASLYGYGANGGITMHFGYREDEYLRIDVCNSTGGYVNQTLQVDKNNRVSINYLNVGSGLNGDRKAEYRLGVYGTLGVTGTSTFKAMTTHSAGLTSTIGNFSGEVSMQSANINGGKITYDATNKYWKLEGDLLVTGGVSMYSDDSEFTPSTIMDGVVVDGTSIRKNPTTGALEVIGGSGATVKYPLSWSGFNQGSYDGSVAQSFYIPTKLSEFVNDRSFATTSDLSGYLPLGGGTVRGMLTIGGRLILGSGNAIQFINADNKELLFYPYSQYNGDLGYYNGSSWGKVWTSTNDGAGSGLDADLLDGKHYSDIINGNVASATKLETPRTIWGQPFDGTANVTGNLNVGDGNLILNNNNVLLWKNTNGENIPCMSLQDNNNLMIGQGVKQKGLRTILAGGDIEINTTAGTTMHIAKSGNVLIGTTTDNGYKLDVNGKVNITSQGDGAELLRFNTERPWVFKQEGTGGTTRLTLYPTSNGKSFVIKNYDNTDLAEFFNTTTDTSYAIFSAIVLPGSDGIYSLGGSTQRWNNSHIKNGYFSNKVEINGIPIYKKQDGVLYIEGNLAVKGGVTMYAENEIDIPTLMDAIAVDATMYNEGGILGVVKASTTKAGAAMFDSNFFSVDDNGLVTLTNAPSSGASYLGKLDNVDDSIDATASVDRVLYQPAGSAMWTWRELPKDGVVGNYLPLSGGTLNGSLLVQANPSEWLFTAKTNTSVIYAAHADNYGIFASTKSASSDHYLLRLHYNDHTLGGSGSIAMEVKCNGVVAIGNMSSNYALNVEGDMYVTNWLRTNNGWYNELYGGGMYMTDNNYIRTYGGKIVYIEETGLTATNTYGIGGHVLQLMIGGSGAPHSSIMLRSNTVAWGICSNSNGNMYIGRRPHLSTWDYSSDVYVLEVSTSGLLCFGGITMYSDQRKKTILNHVELSLKQIADAPLIQHYYNSDQNKTTHVGSIAQYWAGLNDWFCKLDNEGFYTMEIQNAALASAISIARHLEKYESKTDKTIRKMKQRITELEEEVERLKQN